MERTIMLLKVGCLLILNLATAIPQCLADIVIFQSSDTHSEYGNIPNYLRTTSTRAQEFWKQHPGEPVVHLVNGDVTGPSPWTLLHGGDDRGYLNLEIFGRLNHRYLTIMNSGNHEAFDYQAELGIRLFLKQTEDFLNLANSGPLSTPIRLTTANVVPSTQAAHLFQPYQKLISPTGKNIRVVGILLEDFYAYTTYDSLQNTTIHAFTAVRPMLDVAKEQMLRAAAEGADSVIFMYHEQFAIVKDNIQQLLVWKAEAGKTNANLARIEIPVVFAAHDHDVRHEKIESTDIIDSGTGYAFTEVLLDDNGRLKSKTHWDLEKQKQNSAFANLYPEEKLSLDLVNAYLLEAQKKGNEVISNNEGRVLTSTGINDSRVELRQGRRPLGDMVTNILRHWAIDELSASGLLNPATTTIKAVLSFYNSGSYRNGKPIPAGPITRAMAIAPYPMPGNARILLLQGKHVQSMYAALRDFGISKNEVTPQLPSILREKNNDPHHQLEIFSSNGTWAPLDLDGQYALALDTWLGINGFKVPAFDVAFAESQDIPLHQGILNETFLKYFPSYLDQFPSCEGNLVQP